MLALVRSSSRGCGVAARAEAERSLGNRAFRLDSAAGEYRRGDGKADRETQSEMEAGGRTWNSPAMAARHCDCGLQKYRNVLVRPRRDLHPGGMARTHSRE